MPIKSRFWPTLWTWSDIRFESNYRKKPQRALVLTKTSKHIDLIRQVCHDRCLGLTEIGPGAGLVVDDLSEYFKNNDVVFATARMAIEAMASGCAVVVVDSRGLAGMVSTRNRHAWQLHNFGKRLLVRTIDASSLNAALDEYDFHDARIVSLKMRESADLERRACSLVAIYRSAIARAVLNPWTADQILAEFPSVMIRLFSWKDAGIHPSESVIPFFSRIEVMGAELASLPLVET